MSKEMIIMSHDMERTSVMSRGFSAWIRKANDVKFEICCNRGPYGDLVLGVYPTMTEAKSVMGAIMQVYMHEGGIFCMPEASDAEEEEQEPEPEEKNPWRPAYSESPFDDVELPRPTERCLVTTKTKTVAVAWYDNLHNVWHMCGVTGSLILDGVIAWKKLEVEPYEEPEEDD